MLDSTLEILSKNDFTQKLGNRIKEIRISKSISQSELSRLCGKDRQHIELIENNKICPNIYTIYIISNALNITLSELLEF